MVARDRIAHVRNRFLPGQIGSAIGMVVVDGVAIWIGRMARTRLPDRLASEGAAIIFVLSKVAATGLATVGDTLLDAGIS